MISMISRFSSGINVTEATGRARGVATSTRATPAQRASAPACGVAASARARVCQRATSQGIKTTRTAVLLAVVGATLLSLSGCSSDSGGDAAVTVTRSNQAGATTVASQHSFRDCEALVSEVERFQELMASKRAFGGDPWEKPYDDVKENLARNVGVDVVSMLHGADPATFPIGREAALDPHSNKMKRDVREYCGSNFDAAKQKNADGMEKDWKEEGYTPDWEIK